jgi:3-oxoacyl-[acyl-carrier-protein] synthase III
MTMAAHIVGLGVFLPNDPVDNDSIEHVLGRVGGLRSRTRAVILRKNGIRTRHYALDRESGRPTHTNAQMTAHAVRAVARAVGFDLAAIDTLVCGTSSPDQLIPSHGLMVHGELGIGPCEVITTSGVCVSGMTALKYAALAVASEQSRLAVATGSENPSSAMRASYLEPCATPGPEELEADPLLAFDQEFLRWMLSDGAGAAALAPEPLPGRLALRVDWIEIVSHAGHAETCMYWGARKREDGTLQGWRDPDAAADPKRGGFLNLAQDVKLLGRDGGRLMIDESFPSIRRKHGVAAGDVTWFLPHYSSAYFRQEVHDRLAAIDFAIPFDRWFTVLPTKGNTGSASMYTMLDELVASQRAKPGDRILCFVPESARFSAAYAWLTVVEGR